MKPSIFTYLDYRQFLNDMFSVLKKHRSSFSYRRFAHMADSSSPNFLQLIRVRKLNISNSQLTSLAKNLQLSKSEEAYFETLVAFDHAKTHEEKDKYFLRILSTREYHSVKKVEKKQYEYFSHWYNPVIRELLTHPDYPNDPAWIADTIVPSVTITKVKKSINLLVSLDLIDYCKDSEKWIQKDTTISTPSEVLSLAVVNYHKEMIKLGRESITRFKSNDRDIRAITMGVSQKGYTIIKKRMELFWEELLAFSDTEKCTDKVIQINMQLFPMSKNRK